MAVKEYVTKSAFRIKLSRSLFFVKFQEFPIKGSAFRERVCDEASF